MIEYLSKEQVAAMLTTADREVSPKRVYAWVSEGLKVGKRRVRLQAIRLPTGMAFTRELVDKFIAELNSAGFGGHTAASTFAASVPSGRRIARPLREFADHEIGTYPNAADDDLCVPVVRSS